MQAGVLAAWPERADQDLVALAGVKLLLSSQAPGQEDQEDSRCCKATHPALIQHGPGSVNRQGRAHSMARYNLVVVGRAGSLPKVLHWVALSSRRYPHRGVGRRHFLLATAAQEDIVVAAAQEDISVVVAAAQEDDGIPEPRRAEWQW